MYSFIPKHTAKKYFLVFSCVSKNVTKNILFFYYFSTFSHLPRIYIHKENFRLKKKMCDRLLAEVVCKRRQGTLVEEGGLVDEFWMRWKKFKNKWKCKSFSARSAFVLQSTKNYIISVAPNACKCGKYISEINFNQSMDHT